MIEKQVKYISNQKHNNNYDRVTVEDFQYIKDNIEWFNCSKAIYFASGEYHYNFVHSIKKLNIEKIILVDYRFEETIILDNVAIIALEAKDAINLFKYLNLKFDAFICLNDGYGFGGGWYSMYSNYFVAFAMPVLNYNYLHINSLLFFNENNNENINDIGYSSSSYDLNISNKEFFNYKIEDINILKMQKEKVFIESYQIENLKINIINKSIWYDEPILDKLYLKCRLNDYRFTINYKTRLINLKKKSNINILIKRVKKDLDNNNRIGFIPFGNKMLKRLINNIKHISAEINLYHLNKDDYSFVKNNFEFINKVEEKRNELPIYKSHRFRNKLRSKNNDKTDRDIYLSSLLQLF